MIRMNLQLKPRDKAVSPIIATVLLVAITVSLVASAFTLLHNYVPNSGPLPPTATVEVENMTTITNSVTGNYSLTVSQITQNVSFRNVDVVVQFQNGSIYTVSIANDRTSVYEITVNPNLNITVISDTIYLNPGTVMVFSLHKAPSFVSRISLIDSQTDSNIVSAFF